jgi:hypothetical protein
MKIPKTDLGLDAEKNIAEQFGGKEEMNSTKKETAGNHSRGQTTKPQSDNGNGVNSATRASETGQTGTQKSGGSASGSITFSSSAISRVAWTELVDLLLPTASPGEDSSAKFIHHQNAKPEIALPHLGRNESDFAQDILQNLPANILFHKDGFIVEVVTTARGTVGLDVMVPVKFTTWVEQYLLTGRWVEEDDPNGTDAPTYRFKPQTMSDAYAARVLANTVFLKGLPRIDRIIDISTPIKRKGRTLMYPKAGYNAYEKVYCDPNAPKVEDIPVGEALKVIERIHGGFCFSSEQAKTHAIARFITPYIRGVIGFDKRIPCWWYEGNRPGCGKDYLAGCTQIAYQGEPFEDAAIGGSGLAGSGAEETRKRLTAALVGGRRMMHFANCQRHLEDEYFIQAITASTFNARMLGSTSAKSDLYLPNEVDYSLSANIGLTCREDIERRVRKISLAYYEEDENSRTFSDPYLHDWIRESRVLVLSAVHALFKTWWDAGHPKGETPFTSFPKWAEVVGGILMFHKLGDPCLPNQDDSEFGGDFRKRAMTALFEIAYSGHPNEWWTKIQVQNLIVEHKDRDDRLEWFKPMDDNEGKVQLGIALKAFNRRILRGIQMEMNTASSNATRHTVRFVESPF